MVCFYCDKPFTPSTHRIESGPVVKEKILRCRDTVCEECWEKAGQKCPVCLTRRVTTGEAYTNVLAALDTLIGVEAEKEGNKGEI